MAICAGSNDLGMVGTQRREEARGAVTGIANVRGGNVIRALNGGKIVGVARSAAGR